MYVAYRARKCDLFYVRVWWYDYGCVCVIVDDNWVSVVICGPRVSCTVSVSVDVLCIVSVL